MSCAWPPARSPTWSSAPTSAATRRTASWTKYGSQILAQPGQFAWQVFDSKIIPMLRDEYRIRQVAKMDGVDPSGFLRTVREFNAAVDTGPPFNPNIKDGRRAAGLTPPKSDWANRIDEPPYEAYAVTCGVTFTFGGLRITEGAQVIDTDGDTIPGLYACGELVGGIFSFNYPGGSGLTSGTVFGRIAGAGAAASVTAAERAA